MEQGGTEKITEAELKVILEYAGKTSDDALSALTKWIRSMPEYMAKLEPEALKYLKSRWSRFTENGMADDILKALEKECGGLADDAVMGLDDVKAVVDGLTERLARAYKKIKPSMPEGSKPIGNYEEELSTAIKRQNQSADIMASKGYKVEMLDRNPAGNGYGVDVKSSPDYLIEGKVFDCYAPSTDNVGTVIKKMRYKTKKQTPNLILNLDDFSGNLEELIQAILRKVNPDGDLKYLEELYIIKDGRIIDIFE